MTPVVVMPQGPCHGSFAASESLKSFSRLMMILITCFTEQLVAATGSIPKLDRVVHTVMLFLKQVYGVIRYSDRG